MGWDPESFRAASTSVQAREKLRARARALASP
jgi:hypothetical protein